MVQTSHRRHRMSGRDPHEHHRAATPLELLFDLTFVVAFGLAGNELAHALAEAHVTTGLIAFGLAMFAVCWAWINFSWFSSAYDTDDWAFRLLTLVQMAGVLIFALGLPEMFASFQAGGQVDIRLMVGGYVVMRVALVGQWLRAMREDPVHREGAGIYAVSLIATQAGWIALALARIPLARFFLAALALLLIETAGPVVAERRRGGTPWHPHHIAERYGLLTIITLGEVILGTVAAMSVPFHLFLLAGTAAVLVAAVVLADQGLSLAWSMVVVALAPVVTIVGYEALGHRHLQDHLTRLRA